MFKEAISGIRYALMANWKLKWFLLAFVGIYMFNVFFKVDAAESSITLLCVGLVYSAEMLNTAIEHLCDRITISKDYNIKLVKDMSAGAVLFTCVIAVMVAMDIYVPILMGLIKWK